MKRGILLIFCILFLIEKPVYGENPESVQEFQEYVEEEMDYDADGWIEELKEGRLHAVLGQALKGILVEAFAEAGTWKHLLGQLLSIGCFLAVFRSFSNAFLEQYAGKMGYYVAYMMLAGIMSRQFQVMYQLTEETVEEILIFMKLLIPAYSAVLASIGGLTTSVAVYDLFLVLVSLVQAWIIKGILPLIRLQMILQLLNMIQGEEVFLGWTELLESLIRWLLKGAVGIVAVFNIFQSMLLPAIDSVKNQVIQKGLGLLPGVGQAMGMAAHTAIGAGVILKNSIGIIGMIVICCMICMPVLHLFLYVGSFRLAGAFLQPITEKRLYESIKGMSLCGMLLLQTMTTSTVLFLLTIAIVSLSTNF